MTEPTVETKPEASPPESDSGAPAKPAEPAAPAKPESLATEAVVEFKPVTISELKLPEGLTLTEESAKTFNELSAEGKLAPEIAQKFLDQHLSVVKASNENAVAQVTQAFIDQGNAWAKEIREDKAFAGTKLAEAQQTIAKAFDVYGDPKIKEALNATGAGNHPAIFRTIYNMAKAVTEGGGVSKGTPPAPAKSAAQAFYPNMAE